MHLEITMYILKKDERAIFGLVAGMEKVLERDLHIRDLLSHHEDIDQDRHFYLLQDPEEIRCHGGCSISTFATAVRG
jgi:hypothetical protein